MIETKTKQIDERSVSVTQFPARKGLKIKLRLAKMIAPGLASAAGITKDGLESDVDFKVLAYAVGQLVNSLGNDATVDFIAKELMQGARLDDKEITESVFDMEFAGDYGLLYKIIGFILEVNYGSFFENLNIGSLTSKLSSVVGQGKQPPGTSES